MSDVSVIVARPAEIALIAGVWFAVAVLVGFVCYRWRGREGLVWSLTVTVLGPPGLICVALTLMLMSKGL